MKAGAKARARFLAEILFFGAFLWFCIWGWPELISVLAQADQLLAR